MANLFVLSGGSPWFGNGRVTLFQYVTVRPLVFSPVIVDYRGKVEHWDHDLSEFDYRSGRLRAYVVVKHNLTLTSSPTNFFTSGRASIRAGGVPAVGSLTEFAVFPAAAPADPVDFYVQSANAVSTGGVGQAWARSNGVFAVGKSARYLGVGAKFMSVPASPAVGKVQYFKRVQLENAPVGASVPSTYTEAREVRIRVIPDRINWSPNPGFWLDASNWTGLTRTALTGPTSGQCGVATISANPTVVTHTLLKMFVGQVYTARVMVSSSVDATAVPSVSSGATVVSTVPVSANDSNQGVLITFIPTATTVVLTFTLTGTLTSTVTFTDAIVERGEVVGKYFDGSTTSDHMWETGGTAGSTRSYYYHNRAERYSAMMRIIRDNVAMGVGIAVPELGVLPS